MNSKIQIIIIAILSSLANADVKLLNEEAPDEIYQIPGVVYSPTETVGRVNDQITVSRYPSNFCYRDLIKQQYFNNPDQFIRSNLDNEANKRKSQSGEPAIDMLPFRNNCGMDKEFELKSNTDYYTAMRWNNPHDSLCEYNVFKKGLTKVVHLGPMFRCGGGYQDQMFKLNIKGKISGCEKKGDCVLQMYGHSVETRTYAIGVDVITTGGSGNELPEQDAKHYNDAFDTAHYDSTFSLYRGQRSMDDVKAAHLQLSCILQIKSYLGNGGLVGGYFQYTGEVANLRDRLRNEVDNAILAAEAIAIQSNQDAQKSNPKHCFEGVLYQMDLQKNPNCTRQYTTTYVTNTDYCKIRDEYVPKFIAGGLKQYEPKMKTAADIGKTPNDPIGACTKDGQRVQCSEAPNPCGCYLEVKIRPQT